MADQSHAEHKIMRVIRTAEKELPASWAGAGIWANITQETARVILSLRGQLSQDQLAMLLAIGAMAHRQSKVELEREVSRG